MHTVIVGSLDLPGLKNMKVGLETLALMGVAPADITLVLNRADSKVGLSSEDVERVVRAPIAAHVPSSRAVPISINKGTPIHRATPSRSRAPVRVDSQRGTAPNTVPGPSSVNNADRSHNTGEHSGSHDKGSVSYAVERQLVEWA